MDEATQQPVQPMETPSSSPAQAASKISPLLIGVFILLLAAVGVVAAVYLQGKNSEKAMAPSGTSAYPTSTQMTYPTATPTQAQSSTDLDTDTNLDTDLKDLDSSINQL